MDTTITIPAGLTHPTQAQADAVADQIAASRVQGRLSYTFTVSAGGWTGRRGFNVSRRGLYLGFVVPALGDDDGRPTGRWVNSKPSCVGTTYLSHYAAAQPLR